MSSGAVLLLVTNLLAVQSLTLDECVEIALEHNLTLSQLKEEVRAAAAEYRSSWSNFLPNVTLSAGYSRYRSENPWPGGYYTYEDTSYSARVYVTQTLFDSDRFTLAGRLGAQRKVLEMEYEREKLSVSFNAKRDYYALLRAQKLHEVSQTRMRESEKNLEKTEQLYALGSASRAGLLKAKVNLLESRLELTKAEKNVDLAQSNLLVTLGMALSEDIEVKEDSAIDSEEVPPLESVLELAHLHSPELRRAEASMRLAKTNLYASYGSYLPKLSLSASYGYEGNRLMPIRESWDTGRKDWRLGLDISLPIFTGFQRILTTNKAKAEFRSAEYYRKIVERNLALDLKNCYLGIKESGERLKLAEETLELAGESYEAAKERYDLGSAPILELIDAELSLVKAESARIEALYDYRLGIERLKTIVGREDL
jgi:outer membrane protein TolC